MQYSTPLNVTGGGYYLRDSQFLPRLKPVGFLAALL